MPTTHDFYFFMSSLKIRFTEMGLLLLDNGSNYETLKNDISFQTFNFLNITKQNIQNVPQELLTIQ